MVYCRQQSGRPDKSEMDDMDEHTSGRASPLFPAGQSAAASGVRKDRKENER